MRVVLGLACAALVAAMSCFPVRLQAAPDNYYKGKTITLYVSTPPGGGYDLYARLFARHLGNHIPGNPSVVVANMPGGQGTKASNFLFSNAPRDGTALGAFVQTVAVDQAVNMSGVQYDATKFAWIGRIAPLRDIMYVWHTVPVKTVDDLRGHETILAADSSPIANYAHLLSDILGARFKLVRGYPGTQAANLAMERGEVDGAISTLDVIKKFQPAWLQEGKIRIVIELSLKRFDDLPDVPALLEFARTKADRALIEFFVSANLIGRVIAAPPDTPPVIIATLRAAFDETMRDENFVADCRQSKSEVDPLEGRGVADVVRRIVGLSARDLDRVRRITEAND